MPSLSTRYEPASIESRWYEVWEESGVFRPESTGKGEPYCIVIPPPNVTGQLHVGHALNHSIQDVLIRHARKKGKRTLWVPGTDHAGIATQAVVEKLLKKEGTDRFQLGREKFVKRVWEWKDKFGNIITKQMRTLGLSVDWERERFTMDDGLSRAVREMFVELYKKKLIYRDTRMIMWDPVARTVLSDIEVEYEDNYPGELYSFAYKLSQGDGEIVVATTRPETMLGDTAIAVHPEDPRFKKLIGKTVKHPFLDREIVIIADSILVDMEFGTGAVKVTPAHDMNDYETGKRHNLESITIFDEAGRINSKGGSFVGLDRFEARKQIKAQLKERGLERGVKEHKMAIGKSQRSGAIVEPMVSTQWFVSTKPLAKKAIEVVEKGKIRFYPENYANLYNSWMKEIRDWCISRQLWWGHRIPAYHCEDCGHITASVDPPKACEKCKKKNLIQDPDVLDTWFSSGLWPFSTLGWPAKTKDLATFYPTSVLVTSYDIIFFWVVRMVM
ncbi:MAG TPA: valine--tRNA ligase, partial [Leptospiraceae bacterium]|nr:valine--tRNA ligase [Leptospiraceae bacterium]